MPADDAPQMDVDSQLVAPDHVADPARIGCREAVRPQARIDTRALLVAMQHFIGRAAGQDLEVGDRHLVLAAVRCRHGVVAAPALDGRLEGGSVLFRRLRNPDAVGHLADDARLQAGNALEQALARVELRRQRGRVVQLARNLRLQSV